jgi:hypothetical protein
MQNLLRIVVWVVVSWGSLALAPFCLASGQQPASQAPAKLCSKCKSTGKLPNPLADEKWLALETDCLHCSVRVDRDKATGGFAEIPCKNCPSVEVAQPFAADFAKRLEAERAWLAERRKIDAALRPRDAFVHIETTHFQLIFGIDKVVLKDRTTYDAHAAAHLYAKRLEELYKWCHDLLRTSDKEVRNTKHQIYLMGDERTLVKAGEVYASLNTDRAGRVVGDPSILTTWRNKSVFKTDESFHQHVVHHVTHLLVGVFHLKVWLVDDAGWLEEGLAHVAEMQLFGQSGNSCNTEGTEEDMSDSDWEPVTRRVITEGRTVPFAVLMHKKAHLLTEHEHYLAWSYTDFLIRRKPEALREMVIKIKEKKPIRDVLKEVYGLTTTGIDEEWREFVLASYRTKPGAIR